MRLDKYLKIARVIKRRTIANEVSAAGRVSVNGRVAKPSTDIKVGDIIEIAFGSGLSRIRVLDVRETVRKNEASELFEILEEGEALKA
ncbi:MAG: RNA-binding S4 domain-containing protein [Eubacteriales bacterium]|nr:RNA-binding S4 domain-containing protein [Eubacteriales bacterium]